MSKKQLILETAAQLFATKGIDATSVQQITEACGISKGAFYLSFKSKDELIIAIIDYFVKDVAARIDQAVTESQNNEEKLYNYYYQIFSILQEHATLASVFFKEHTQFVNEDFIQKMAHYDTLMNKLIENLLLELYPQAEAHVYDLAVIVRGFISGYSEHLFHKINGHPYDLQTLAKSLVEKTTIIATHAKMPFITKEMVAIQSADETLITAENIIHEASILSSYLDDEVLQDSVNIIKEQLQSSKPRPAIIQGMLNNLRVEPVCNWFCFLVKEYMQKEG
ncbi:TetR/AcrR family transcriptional regulator [Metasolibacillus meyeri]|uniref:TetR/AcrR family transcriptional regulator n=1 Tax=Metasolibacillus meyeri TaxID=1071052 RepID=A0AAW9NQ77_9BACL|nr:TetR/AcrR family transcriptional regulator [Metasolibacillus meyeri]MEC1179827.1 TetR/AcrR family transcriptional regulator [Metasolibacillus meyeri]